MKRVDPVEPYGVCRGEGIDTESGDSERGQGAGQRPQATWTFLSNHAHVVVCIARDPSIRLPDIAAAVGITERAAQRIVSELAEVGYLDRTRSGRRNPYRVRLDQPLRHSLEADAELGSVITGVVRSQG